MGVSKNSGTPPNHPFFIGFSITNHPFWGTTIVGNPHIPQTARFFVGVVCLLACHLSIGSNTKSWADVAGSGKTQPTSFGWTKVWRFVRIFVAVGCKDGCKDSYMLVVATQTFLEFSPRSLGKWSNLTSIFFQLGWNHQLVIIQL